jgi:hypothetical protein
MHTPLHRQHVSPFIAGRTSRSSLRTGTVEFVRGNFELASDPVDIQNAVHARGVLDRAFCQDPGVH